MKAYKLTKHTISVPRFGNALMLMFEYLSDLDYPVSILVTLNRKTDEFAIDFDLKEIRAVHFDNLLIYINANL